MVRVDTRALPADVATVAVTASLDGSGPPTFAAAGPLVATVGPLTFEMAGLSTESAVVCVEIYRRGEQWKVRAVGQGYDDGLAGIASAFGVDVDAEPEPAPPPPAPPAAAPPATPRHAAGRTAPPRHRPPPHRTADRRRRIPRPARLRAATTGARRRRPPPAAAPPRRHRPEEHRPCTVTCSARTTPRSPPAGSRSRAARWSGSR